LRAVDRSRQPAGGRIGPINRLIPKAVERLVRPHFPHFPHIHAVPYRDLLRVPNGYLILEATGGTGIPMHRRSDSLTLPK
jgi:hypothetical protein